MYIVRSGLIYQCLGNIYREKLKKKGRNIVHQKQLLHLCRLYHEKSANILHRIDTIDYLGVQVDRLELQNVLFEGIVSNYFTNNRIYFLIFVIRH